MVICVAAAFAVSAGAADAVVVVAICGLVVVLTMVVVSDCGGVVFKQTAGSEFVKE